jgi:VIT1/CCC1 family predicted Fe2+/Mn2+ transporter
LPLTLAIVASIAWGLLVIALLSLVMARAQHQRPLPVVAEHVGIALLVVIVTHYVGDWVARTFA